MGDFLMIGVSVLSSVQCFNAVGLEGHPACKNAAPIMTQKFCFGNTARLGIAPEKLVGRTKTASSSSS